MSRRACALAAALLASAGTRAAGQQVPLLQATRDLTIEGKPSGFTVKAININVADDGTIALHEAGTQKVVLVSSDGKHLETIGTIGDKPGEFLDVRWLGWTGDSLWIADPNLVRITLFTPRRKVARVFPMPTLVPGPPGTIPVELAGDRQFPTPFVIAIYPGGGLLVEVPRRPMGVAVSLPLLHLSPDAQFVALLGGPTEPTPECAIPFPITPRGLLVFLPVELFCSSPPIAVAPSGQSIVRVHGIPATGDSGTFTVTRLDGNGDTVYQRSYPFASVPVTKEEADSGIAFKTEPMIKMGPALDPADLARIRSAYSSSMPRGHTPVTTVVAGNDGTAWLQLFTRGPESDWLILDPKGDPIGTVVLPTSICPHQVTRDRVWGEEVLPNRDINVVRYAVTRGSP